MIQQIGPYRIEREIGRGGMGVVYLAHDDRLDRHVAIKALPEELARDVDRLERFEREARTLASLNHPNIGQIYGVEEQEGKKFLILEYVEGETLGDRLDRGALPVDEALEIVIEIAKGLEAAHEAGVIHRDLKPDNIKLTSEAKVKVLDFGLAKTSEGPNSSGIGLSRAPTLTGPAPQHSPTIPGAILGTAAYMSPEQARGRKVDKRTDIWSFGVILYEMLTGVGPFAGETAMDSIGAVLHKDIELDRLPSGAPLAVRHVLSRCLARDRALRYRDIGDVRIELSAPAVEAVAAPARGTPGRWGVGRWAAVALVVAAAGAAGWIGGLRMRSGEPARLGRFDLFTESEKSKLEEAGPKISPDGRSVAYIQSDGVHVRDLGSFAARTLPDTDGAQGVFWSPDGSWLGYYTTSDLHKAPRTGGGSIKIAGGLTKLGEVAGGWWNERDQIALCIEPMGIATVSAKGGSPVSLVPTPERGLIDFHDVSGIPGSYVLLYLEHRDDMSFVLVAADGDRRAELVTMTDAMLANPTYSPSGHVLFARGPGEWSIWAVAFDVDTMEVRGDPFLVETDASQPSVAVDGTLVCRRRPGESGSHLAWVSRAGEIERIGDDFKLLWNPLPSPDGKRLAFVAGTTNKLDIWVRDLARGVNSRITFDEGLMMPVSWSPDGRELAIIEFDPSTDARVVTRFVYSDGSGESRPPVTGGMIGFDAAWKRAAMVSAISPTEEMLLSAAAVDAPEDRVVLGRMELEPASLALRPDGSLLLYSSDESGQVEVYCIRFPQGSGKWQVSRDGGAQPIWSSDGQRLYYMSPTDTKIVYEVEVSEDPSLEFGVPRQVMDLSEVEVDSRGGGWTIGPDGERFLVVESSAADSEARSSISIIQNWAAEYFER